MTTTRQTPPPLSLFSPQKNNLTILSTTTNTLKCHNLQTSPPTLQCTLRPRPTPSHTITQISHATPTLLVARSTPPPSSSSSSDDSHAIYDLTRGVVARDISLGSQYTLLLTVPCQFRNAKSHEANRRYYVVAKDDASSKLYALEYNADTHALSRKIKCGKLSSKQQHKLSAALSPDGKYLYLVKSTECRVLRLSDGGKKNKSDFDEVPRRIYAPLDGLLVAVFDNIVILYKFIQKEKEWERVECCRWNKGDEEIESVEVFATEEEDEEDGPRVQSVLINGRILYDVEGDDCRIVTTLATEFSSSRRIVAGRFATAHRRVEVFLIKGDDASDIVVETVAVGEDATDVTYVGRRVGEDDKTTTKRRYEDDDEPETKRLKKKPEIVGFGPNDVEHLATREFSIKKDDEDDEEEEDDEPTIAERLRAMEKYADDLHSPTEPTPTTTTTSTPTTDSLVQLLTQTLRANDDTTLESSLLHQPLPPTLIENTLSQLLSQNSLEDSNLLIERLMERLVYKLGTSPWRSRVLTTWLRCLIVVVVRGRKGGMLVRMLPGLRNLIGERMESMKDLMCLEGRLMLIGGSGGGGGGE